SEPRTHCNISSLTTQLNSNSAIERTWNSSSTRVVAKRVLQDLPVGVARQWRVESGHNFRHLVVRQPLAAPLPQLLRIDSICDYENVHTLAVSIPTKMTVDSG